MVVYRSKFSKHLEEHTSEILFNTVITTGLLIVIQLYLLGSPPDVAFTNGILIALLLTLNA